MMAGSIARFSPLHNKSTGLRRPALTAFLCSLATAAIFILPFIISGGGVFYVSNDQITQQLPFTQQIVRNLHSGNFSYDFTLDLGSGVIEGYTWYNLGSVFSLVQYLLPAAATPYLLGPMLILKFGFAGLFSYLWLRRYTRTDMAALIGSLCYSFCGMAITNMVFPFQDVYSLFPLLPLCMDGLLEDRRAGPFALAVALNVLVNPPLFLGAAVFMILYFTVKWAYKSYAVTLKKFAHLALEALCGVAISGFILLPFVASLAANPRVEGIIPFGKDWFIYVAYRYFEIARSMVLPAEVMHKNGLFLLFDAVSPEGYLPLFGLVTVFAYVCARKRNWLRALLLASFSCMLVPVLNSAFNAFNSTYYTRWLYMPMLAAALAAALFLEDGTIPLRRGYAVWGAFAALLVASVVLWLTLFRYDSFITYGPGFVACLVLGAASLGATAFSRRTWQRAPRLLCAGVMLFAIASGAINLAFNHIEAHEAWGPLTDIPAKTFEAGGTTPLPDGVYRTNAPVANQYLGHSSPFSFNSTVSACIFEMQAAFGRQRTSASVITYDEVGLWSLLGVKYILVSQGETEVSLPNTAFYAAGEEYDVVENKDALPYVMGFDSWFAAEGAEALDGRQKSIALLHGLALSETARENPTLALEEIPAGKLAMLGYDAGVAARKAAAATDVQLLQDGLSATLTLPTQGAALITLPYDAGWQCTVNGVPQTPLKADWGLMAVLCPAGTVQIEMRYRPVGGAAGWALTAVGLAGLAALFLWPRLRKKRPA